MRRCVGGATQKIRQTQIERRSGPGDSLRRGRFSGYRFDRVLLVVWSEPLQRIARSVYRDLHARWERTHTKQRRHLQKPKFGENAAINWREWARRLLQRRDR